MAKILPPINKALLLVLLQLASLQRLLQRNREMSVAEQSTTPLLNRRNDQMANLCIALDDLKKPLKIPIRSLLRLFVIIQTCSYGNSIRKPAQKSAFEHSNDDYASLVCVSGKS